MSAAEEENYALRRTPTQVLAMTLKRLYPQNPDVVLGREARTILEEFEKAGLVVIATNDTRAHAMRQRDDLRAEVDRLRGVLSDLASGGYDYAVTVRAEEGLR